MQPSLSNDRHIANDRTKVEGHEEPYKRMEDASGEYMDANDDRPSTADDDDEDNWQEPQQAFQTPPAKVPAESRNGETVEFLMNTQEHAALVLGVTQDEPGPLQAYPMRYYILIVTSLLITSNTMVWISLAPVSNYADVFFDRTGAANMLSVVYLLATILFGVFAMWASGRFGLRASILTAACFNGVGASIRLGSCFLPISIRFPLALTGQAIAACAYPFIMFLPTKVAGSWFPESQLTLATMVATLSNPLGVLLPNLIVPKLVASVDDITLVTALVFVPCIVAMAMAMLGVRSNGPPTPPTHAAGLKQMDFCAGVKKCFRSRAFLVLCFALGGGIGMFNCFYTVFQQLICPHGYSNQFSGICPTLMIVCGFVGGTAAAIVADKTKMYEELFKTSFSLTTISGIVLMQLCMHANFHIWIVLACCVFGFFGLAAYGLGLSLGAECTFPVAETTSTGIIVLVGQVQSTIFVLIMKFFANPLPDHLMDIQSCTVEGEEDSTVVPMSLVTPSLILSAIATIMAVVNVFIFKPKYRRQNTNRETETARQEKLKAVHGELEVAANGNAEEMIDLNKAQFKPERT